MGEYTKMKKATDIMASRLKEAGYIQQVAYWMPYELVDCEVWSLRDGKYLIITSFGYVFGHPTGYSDFTRDFDDAIRNTNHTRNSDYSSWQGRTSVCRWRKENFQKKELKNA